VTSDGSPFKCDECGHGLREGRNCANARGLSQGSRIVRKFTADVSEEIKRRGAVRVFSLGEIRFYECPLTSITADTLDLIRVIYLIESSGRLFFDGGWSDQPHWLVEAYEIYKRESFEYLKGRKNGE